MGGVGEWVGDNAGKVGGAMLNPVGYLGNSSIMGGGGKGGGKGGEAPGVPDFMGAVDAQAGAARDLSREQTQANRPNQSGPFGSSQWTQGPDGQWTQQTSLNGPYAQAAAGYGQQMADQAGQPLPDGSAARDQAIDAAYGQATSRLDPQWSSRATALQSQLANQGLAPGSEAETIIVGKSTAGRLFMGRSR